MPKQSSARGVLDDLYARPGHLMRRCQQIHVALFLRELKRLELTPIQYSIMFVLTKLNGIDQATLAGLVAIDRCTVGNVLMRLDSRGLVKRERSPDDGRSRVVQLTRKGRKLARDAGAPVARVQQLLLSPLSKNERAVFVESLRKIADAHNEASRAPVRHKGNLAAG